MKRMRKHAVPVSRSWSRSGFRALSWSMTLSWSRSWSRSIILSWSRSRRNR
jgi:hypothetical protein